MWVLARTGCRISLVLLNLDVADSVNSDSPRIRYILLEGFLAGFKVLLLPYVLQQNLMLSRRQDHVVAFAPGVVVLNSKLLVEFVRLLTALIHVNISDVSLLACQVLGMPPVAPRPLPSHQGFTSLALFIRDTIGLQRELLFFLAGFTFNLDFWLLFRFVFLDGWRLLALAF